MIIYFYYQSKYYHIFFKNHFFLKIFNKLQAFATLVLPFIKYEKHYSTNYFAFFKEKNNKNLRNQFSRTLSSKKKKEKEIKYPKIKFYLKILIAIFIN